VGKQQAKNHLFLVFFDPPREKVAWLFPWAKFLLFPDQKTPEKVIFCLLFSHWKNPQIFCCVKLTGNQKLSPEFSILEKFHLGKCPVLKARFSG
jgi:hypothetical protein